jgi:hypothetical protein
MKRFILIGGATVAVVVVVAAILLYSSLDAIVKAAIEKVGSDVTGTRVRVDGVNISPTSGAGTLRGFRVTNPDGFERDDAFQFDEITMKIDLTTLASDPVVIEEIVVLRPRIRYEFGGRGTNVGEIQKNVEGYSEERGVPEGPNLIIQNLFFRDGKVNVAGGSVLRHGVTTPLPDLHIRDIGTEENGATPAVVVKKVVGALGRKVTTAVASLNLGDVGHDAASAIESGAEEAKDAAGKAGRKLKGLFKKKNDD